jgi:hypothetical protein
VVNQVAFGRISSKNFGFPSHSTKRSKFINHPVIGTVYNFGTEQNNRRIQSKQKRVLDLPEEKEEENVLAV